MKIENLGKELEPLRNTLKNHLLYTQLDSLDDIKTFMESHVYAVWDFMSLLKALQRSLTCVDLPWQPRPNTEVARFINEIVLEEETDRNELGEPKSHFEMYLDAMKEVGADTEKVQATISSFNNLDKISNQIKKAQLNQAEKDFLQFTFDVISTRQPHIIAAAFTFGREDLIPDMFLSIIEQSGSNGPSRYKKLEYYLKRHIELDGDEHGPLALRMIKSLCGADEQKWDDVKVYSTKALKVRIALWNSIAQTLEKKKSKLVGTL